VARKWLLILLELISDSAKFVGKAWELIDATEFTPKVDDASDLCSEPWQGRFFVGRSSSRTLIRGLSGLFLGGGI